LSSPAIKPNADLDWKQEVNQRLAAHKSRKDAANGENAGSALPHPAANSRAAQAAARVAARYAQAPSYSQMLADEARAAVRAAEAATHAARKMQAAAESVLAELENAAAPAPASPRLESARHEVSQPDTYFDSFLEIERPVAVVEERTAPGELKIRWEPDMPVRLAQPMAAQPARRAEQCGLTLEDWRGSATLGEPETVEPAQPIPGNLIEFPRELIAARKARPRIAEGPLAGEEADNGQLSIFEVDPGSISIEPAPAVVSVEPHSPGWSKLLLDTEAAQEPAREVAHAAHLHPVESAPLHLRLLAAAVDGGLIGAIFCVAATAAAMNVSSQPSMKAMELAGGAALFAIWLLYQGLFLTFAGITPGMRYAGIALATFEDQQPSREQLRRRVGAVLLSVLPMGLGLLWALFDEDHLTWHDRISHTYPRWA
jgi:uncharacterized RDD family membrane protein YckC